MNVDDIHPQLLADCHHLGSLTTGALLLNRNSALPWLILVPETALPDFLDLADEHRSAVLADCALVADFIKHVLGYDKVNFAGLGNVVPQMHLHIVGRREGDACWPKPVWGNLPDGGPYSEDRVAEWRDELVQMAGLVPALA